MNTYQVIPANLDFSIPNPRFAGINYDSNDIKPYGKSIDKMFSSMVETYKKTGSLLLQPVVCESQNNKFVVRAGYTRAHTFYSRYDQLCKECGVDSLTLPIVVMDGMNIVDSLMENVVRSDQHFVTMAHAIKSALYIKNVTLAKVAHQLGITVQKATIYKKISGLHESAIKLCFENKITEDGAAALAEMPEKAVTEIVEYIIDQDRDEAYDKKDILRVFSYAMPEINNYCPKEAFTDLSGFEHPVLTEEEWYVNIGDIFESARTSDTNATKRRTRAYWDKFISDNQLEVLDYNTVSYNHKQVEFGTHPEEFAAWDHSGSYIKFYMKRSDVEKLDAGDELIVAKQKKYIDAVNSKIVKLKEAARHELTFGFFSGKGDIALNMEYAVRHAISNRWAKNSEKDAIEVITAGVCSEYRNLLDHFSVEETMNIIYMVDLLCSASWFPKNLEAFLNDNGLDVDKYLNEAYAEIDAKRDEMLAVAQEKSDDLGEDASNRKMFVEEMFSTICYETGECLFDSLAICDESLLKFVARTMDIKYKGSANVMRIRIKSYLEYFIKSHGLVINKEATIDAKEVFSLCKETAEEFICKITPENPVNGLTLTSNFNTLANILVSKNLVIGSMPMLGYDVKGIIRSSDTKIMVKAFVSEFYKKASDYFTVRTGMAYANDKNKIVIA